MCEINGKTKLFCLLGSPIEHSHSPFIYNSAFSKMHLNYKYMAFDVKENDLPSILNAFKKMGVLGCNLTMPLKKIVFPYLDEMSNEALMIKAANTIIFKDNKIYGDTTDGKGFLKALLKNDFNYDNKIFTILGCGGAGSSIVAALSQTSAKEINIVVRKEHNSLKELLKRIKNNSSIPINLYMMNDLSLSIKKSDILVNTTYVGMKENDNLLVSPKDLRKDLFVADIIYNPLETKLLSEAKKVGAKTMNGLDMLHYQAVLSFKIFTGKTLE